MLGVQRIHTIKKKCFCHHLRFSSKKTNQMNKRSAKRKIKRKKHTHFFFFEKLNDAREPAARTGRQAAGGCMVGKKMAKKNPSKKHPNKQQATHKNAGTFSIINPTSSCSYSKRLKEQENYRWPVCRSVKGTIDSKKIFLFFFRSLSDKKGVEND